MEIGSLCALPASGFEWRPQPGAFALTVVCKATYLLAPGRAVLAREQDPPVEEDEHWDDDGARSLRAASDLVPYKPWADVVLVGPAYAPGKEAVRTFRARLVVGTIDKSVVVWCDRSRSVRDGLITLGPPITKLPLLWERAAGGPHTDNPVGMRLDTPPDAAGRVAIPNLQPPGTKLDRADSFAPVGLGPLSPRWPARARALGGAALPPRWQDQPLPDDFDYSYFNVAPPDQRMSWIQPDQRIALEGLHLEHPFFVTALPGVEPRAVVDRATGEREEVALVADTLCFDTERGVCTVVWRGRIGLRHAGEEGRVSFWLADAPASDATRPAGTPEPAELSETRTDTLLETARRALPFSQRLLPPPAEEPGESTLMLPAPGAHKAPLPFRPASPSEPVYLPPRSEPPPAPEERNTLVEIDVSPPGALTPFVQPEPHRPAPSTEEIQGEDTVSLNEPGVDPLFVFSSARAALAPSPEPPALPPPPVPPPLLVEVPAVVAAPPPVAPTAAPEPPPPPPPEEAFDPASFGLERWAALTARLALRRQESSRILAEEELVPARWAEVERRWDDALQAEARRGKSALLRRSDAAYVAEVERLRGAITVDEYAKIAVSAERGTRRETMAELGLPMGAALRIERVWIGRMFEEPSLVEQTNEAVARARDAE